MEKLKILIVTQGEWLPRFGALKVHIDIKEEYERQGHLVDKVSLEDLYPYGQSVLSKIFGKGYAQTLLDYLKTNASKYDVIDANFYSIIYPKNSFGFEGVLMFRSHGIGPVYEWAAQNIESYKKALAANTGKSTLKTKIGNIYRGLHRNVGAKEFEVSLKYPDIAHCLNKAEYQYFKEQGVPESKLLLVPNGIPDNSIHQMNLTSTKSRRNSVCFIGAWNVRKGIYDMDEIISLISQKIDLEEVVLLGGHYPRKTVESFFSTEKKSKLVIIPKFDKSEMSGYVKECKVGLFPSYVEGHPLALLEQLSLGIPVVSYRVPGSADILEGVDDTLLVPPGDTHAFANKVIEVLQLDLENYQLFSDRCKAISRTYLLSDVTKVFVSNYQKCLNRNEKNFNHQAFKVDEVR